MISFTEFIIREATDQQIIYFAKEIMNALEQNASVDRIKGFLYWLMTTTEQHSGDLSKSIPALLHQKYNNTLQSLNFGPNVKTKDSGVWFHIYFPNLQRPNRMKIGDAKFTFKSYFTVNMGEDVNQLTQNLSKFFNNIRILVPELHKIFANNNDSGQLKFPSDIHSIIEHPDTLVIHYYNKQSKPAIDKVIGHLFTQQKDRNIRASSGFDMEHKGVGESHSQLIAGIIAGAIVEFRDKILKQYTPETLASKIKEKIQFWNNQDEETLYKYSTIGKTVH